MTRRRALRVVQGNAALRPRMQQLKAEHPFWGYRRLWASLRVVEQQPVNKKRVLRLLREHQLLVRLNPWLKAKRIPMGHKLKPTKPNEWWGIDVTKLLGEGCGWVYIVLVLDWQTKVVLGRYAGLQYRAPHWLVTLDRAVNHQFPTGAQGQDLALTRDNGGQPTSVAFMKACSTLGLQQAFTSSNYPKGNADTELLMRPPKGECLWLTEGTCPLELMSALEDWITDDNEHYLHSALGYRPPRQFERNYHLRHGTQLTAA